MKAWVFKTKDDPGGWIEQDPAGLPDLPVLVRITHSGINYKDALSLTRRAPIARSFPDRGGHRPRRHGCRGPEQGPVVVTGPTGGGGSFASLLLKHSGYYVIAATGRTTEGDYLKANGAAEVIDRAEFETEPRPLSKERWCAGIDVVGGKVLACLLSSAQYGGAIAACGLAGRWRCRRRLRLSSSAVSPCSALIP
jgi:NADPH:quinone reductase-like Zn-dependent oxidoreductase